MDHSYVNDAGVFTGMSVNLNGLITGEMDPEEQVVIDFSACKKQIKYLIDDTDIGIDHKLVLYNAHSKYVMSDDNTQIHTPKGTVNINGNITIIPDEGAHIGESLCKYLDREISKYLTEKHGTVITFKSEFDTNFKVPEEVSTWLGFAYTHGLKNSSSYGCQNIAHGHLSYLGFVVDMGELLDERKKEISDLLQSIADQYDNKVLLCETDMKKSQLSFDSTSYLLQYESMTRGAMEMNIIDLDSVVLFDTDTTVENIVEKIYNDNLDAFKALGITKLYVSEGLSKGAMKVVV